MRRLNVVRKTLRGAATAASDTDAAPIVGIPYRQGTRALHTLGKSPVLVAAVRAKVVHVGGKNTAIAAVLGGQYEQVIGQVHRRVAILDHERFDALQMRDPKREDPDGAARHRAHKAQLRIRPSA